MPRLWPDFILKFQGLARYLLVGQPILVFQLDRPFVP